MIRTVGRDGSIYRATCWGQNYTVRFGGGCGAILEFHYEDAKERYYDDGGTAVFIRCPECDRGIRLGLGYKEKVLRGYRKTT